MGMGRKRGRKGKEDERGVKRVERGGRGGKEKGKKKERGKGKREGRDDTPLFWYKVTPMSASDIHTRRIGLASSSIILTC